MVEVLALIPARGGSKSIPRKNIKLLAGHPLLAYSIAAGRAARSVSRVLVSTDDAEIAAVAHRYGAETPFLRPATFAQDATPDLPVFEHALAWLKEHENYIPDIVVQLRPTSPLRRVAHIDGCVQLLLDHPQADAARTVIPPFQNPFKMWRIGTDGFLLPLGAELGMANEAYNQPRQALPAVFWQTGYVDACRTATILQKKSMTGGQILPLICDTADWIDIDSPDDWRRAERLLESGEISLTDLGFDLSLEELHG